MRSIRPIHSLLLILVVLAISATAFAGVFVSVSIAPPALPVYTQPICPGPGYAWTPGYWGWGPDGYYWVPGTWVVAPVGLLWTPGYWGFSDGVYAWREGYWGPTVGFYGGINYGFGYPGVGFAGGYWRGRDFFYNRAVTNVNVTVVRNVYTKTVVRNVTVNRVSFNGGNGGINARPTAVEERAAHEQHTPPVAMQQEHERAASKDRVLLASTNHGRPEIAATAKAGEFSHGAVAASKAGAPYEPKGGGEAKPEANRSGGREVPRPPASRGANANGTEGKSERASAPKASSRNNVPRPDSANRNSTPRPESTPRPDNATRSANQPRPNNESRPNNVPKPENTPRAGNNKPRPDTATRSANQPRPNNAPKPETARRENTPHPDSTPQRENAGHADRAGQQQRAPQPEKKAPGGDEDRPR